MAVDDSLTKSLLHFDGADGGTVFTDESGKAWTAAADAQLDTAQYKFAPSSLLLDGTGDYIYTDDHADFDVGSGDFTIDCWIKPSAINADYFMFGQGDAAGAAASRSVLLWITSGNKLISIIYSGTSFYAGTSATSISTAWTHYAMARNGNTLTQFFNGTADGTKDVTGVTVNNGTSIFCIGAVGLYASYRFNGWIDEFRFSKGTARWTSNFTPPTSAYAPPVISAYPQVIMFGG